MRQAIIWANADPIYRRIYSGIRVWYLLILGLLFTHMKCPTVQYTKNQIYRVGPYVVMLQHNNFNDGRTVDSEMNEITS